MSEALNSTPVRLIQPRLETCGTCRYGKPIQIGVTECWGAPPTPAIIGGKPNVAGQVEMTIELLRPRIASNTSRCALWAEKPAMDLNDVGMAGRG